MLGKGPSSYSHSTHSCKAITISQFGGSLFTVNFKILLCHFSHHIALLDIQMEMKRINPDKNKLTITTAKG